MNLPTKKGIFYLENNVDQAQFGRFWESEELVRECTAPPMRQTDCIPEDGRHGYRILSVSKLWMGRCPNFQIWYKYIQGCGELKTCWSSFSSQQCQVRRGEKPTGADIAERFPLPQPLQFLMAKEPGDIILKGHPFLQSEKFRVGFPEGSTFTQNLAADAYGAHSSLNLFLEESSEILSWPLNLTDMEAWAPGLARLGERKQPVQVYTAINGWAGIRARWADSPPAGLPLHAALALPSMLFSFVPVYLSSPQEDCLHFTFIVGQALPYLLCRYKDNENLVLDSMSFYCSDSLECDTQWEGNK